MANDKVYIHELVDIRDQNRANYMHHITANWSPIGRRERNQLCYGIYGTVGSTGRWPEVVNMWEEDGWQGVASSFRHELSHPTLQDPSLAEWWARAAHFRRGGFDRLLVPAPWTRTIEELCEAGVRGALYAHELVECRPGTAWDYLSMVEGDGIAVHERFGFELAGAFATAMRNDTEVLLLWAIPEWAHWGEFEASQYGDPAVAAWRERISSVVVDWRRVLLVDAPLSPMRTGRQPRESDRDAYTLTD